MIRWFSDRFAGRVGLGAADRRLLRESRQRSSAASPRNGRANPSISSDAELRALFNAMSDLVMVIDDQGRYVSIAPTNLPENNRPSHLIDRTVWEIWPPDVAEAFMKLQRHVIATGETRQFVYRRPDIPEERWESATVTRLAEDRVLIVARDVTELKRNEQLIGAREAELRALFSAMTDTVVSVSREGRCIAVAPTNPNQPHRYGASLVGKVLEDILPPDQAAEFRATIGRCLDRSESTDVEYTLGQGADMDWYRATISPSGPDTVVWVARNITRTKKDEGLIAEREAEMRAVFAAMSDVVFVMSRDGEYVRAAPTIPAMSDASHNRTAWLIGRRVSDVLAAPWGEEALAAIRAALDHGETRSLEYRVDYGPDEFRWYSASISPMTHDSVVWVARDVTRRRRDHELMAEREEQYRSIFESTSDALFITDMDNRIVDANPAACAMHGYTLEEMRALEPFALVHSSSRGATSEYLKELREGKPYRGRSRNVRKDGSTFVSESLGTPITYRGKPHILSIERDITEQVESELLLEQRVEDRTREVTSLLDVAQNVASTLDLDQLILRITDELQTLIGYTGASLLIAEGADLVIRHSRPVSEGALGVRFPVSTTNALGVIAGGQPLVIDDVRGAGVLAEGFRDLLGERIELPAFRNVRSWAGIPMMLGDRIVGLISLSHVEPGYFKAHHLTLAQGFASHAAIAVENARLFEESRGRARELSALLHVSQAVASTLDLQTLARLILEEMVNVADYTGATLAAVQNDELVILDSWGPYRDEVVSGPTSRIPLRNVPAALWKTLQDGKPLVIGDTEDDSYESTLYRRMFGPFLDLPSFSGIRAWLLVPLLRQEKIIGMLTAAHDEPHHFTPERVSLVAAAAGQAAVAIENARLYEEEHQRTRELTALLEISSDVTSTLELGPLLSTVLGEMKTVVDYDRSSILVLDGDDLVKLGAGARVEGQDQGVAPGQRISVKTVMPRIWAEISGGRPVIMDNVRKEDDVLAAEYRAFAGDLLTSAYRDIHSWLGVPLILQDRIVGMLTLSKNDAGYYNERHSRIATTIANHSAVAIENARLFEETQQRTRELTTLIEISKDVTSELELRPLLSTVLDEMRTIVDYNRASIMVREGDALVVLDSRLSEGGAGDEPVGMRIPLEIAGDLWEPVQRGEAVFVANVRDEEDSRAAAYRTIAGPALETAFRDVRSWLGVPLALKDGVIGALTLSKDEPGFYNERHARLAMPVANQAAVAIENARLFEQAEGRARELAALLDVSHTVVTTLDVNGLVNLILDQLHTIIDYTGASVTMLDGEEFSIMASRSASGDSAVGARIPLSRAEPLWQRILRLEPVVIDDIRSDEPMALEYRAIFGRGIDTTPFRDIRSWMAVPLAPKDRAIGTLTISHTEPGHFNERHVRLLRAVADQAAVAIENARLYEESQQRARETDALLRADAELFRSLDLDAVLQSLVDVAVDVLGADKCMVALHHGRVDVVRAARNYSEQTLDAMKRQLVNMPHEEPEPDQATPRVYDDIASAPAFIAESLKLEGIASHLSIPIRDSRRMFGAFGISFMQRRRLSEHEKRLFVALGDRAAIAIQNAELYERAQHAASLEERQRLARELHDSVSQALYGIALGARTARTQLDRDPARAVEPVDYVLSLAEAGLAEMRALIFELRPESLELEGLVAGLEKQAAALRARHGVEVEADLCGEPDVPMPVKEAISRIAQEAMHNTVKHAHAKHVALRLAFDEGVITLEVQDDGRGFDPGQTFAGHLGLRSMRERATNLGGKITIDSHEGDGARIRVSIPVANSQPAGVWTDTA